MEFERQEILIRDILSCFPQSNKLIYDVVEYKKNENGSVTLTIRKIENPDYAEWEKIRKGIEEEKANENNK